MTMNLWKSSDVIARLRSLEREGLLHPDQKKILDALVALPFEVNVGFDGLGLEPEGMAKVAGSSHARL